MKNYIINFSQKKGKLKIFLPAIFCLILFSAFSQPEKDEVLLTVDGREITTYEFLYSFKKNCPDQESLDIDLFLEQFIVMQLKIAQAKEEKEDRTISFITEINNYRSRLAESYLTHPEKEEELAREAYGRLFYEIDASHILVKIDPADTLKAWNKAIHLRDSIIGGKPFGLMAQAFSDDPDAIKNSGRIGYFTAFQTEYNFETAAYNMKPGELSAPVRTSLGYHIILCHNKRDIIDGRETIPPYEEIKSGLKRRIKSPGGPRAEIIREKFAEKLKQDWHFTENPDALKLICSIANEKIFTEKIHFPPDINSGQVLMTIDGKAISLNDFAEFISEQEAPDAKPSVKDFIRSNYQKFVAERLITYENYKLEEKNPEFRCRLWEYRDAMLLLKITEKEVWQKAVSDSLIVIGFYRQNLAKYQPEANERQQIKFSEIPEAALSGYQDLLMTEWVSRLRQKYKVKINRDVLLAVKKEITQPLTK